MASFNSQHKNWFWAWGGEAMGRIGRPQMGKFSLGDGCPLLRHVVLLPCACSLGLMLGWSWGSSTGGAQQGICWVIMGQQQQQQQAASTSTPILGYNYPPNITSGAGATENCS